MFPELKNLELSRGYPLQQNKGKQNLTRFQETPSHSWFPSVTTGRHMTAELVLKNTWATNKRLENPMTYPFFTLLDPAGGKQF